jgi:hypothetical protein
MKMKYHYKIDMMLNNLSQIHESYRASKKHERLEMFKVPPNLRSATQKMFNLKCNFIIYLII